MFRRNLTSICRIRAGWCQRDAIENGHSTRVQRQRIEWLRTCPTMPVQSIESTPPLDERTTRGEQGHLKARGVHRITIRGD